MHSLAPSALVVTLLAIAGTAHADLIAEGTVWVRHEIRVELGRDFPDTSFVVFPTDLALGPGGRDSERGVSVISSASPVVRLGKFPIEPRLWAVRGPLPADPQQIDRAWLTARGAVCSAHVFGRIKEVPEDEGIDRITTLFRVVEVTASAVRLEGVSEERFAPDGAVKSRSVPPLRERPVRDPTDRRGGWLERDSSPERAPTGLAMARLDPTSALSIAGAALGLLLLRVRRPALAARA